MCRSSHLSIGDRFSEGCIINFRGKFINLRGMVMHLKAFMIYRGLIIIKIQ